MPRRESVWPLAEFVAGLRPADLPPEVARKARSQLASALAAMLGARLDPAVRKVLASVRARGTAGPARLLTYGEPATVHDAVLGNATASCAFDWDEILLLGHPSHSAVTVSLALAAARDLPLEAALTAQVAANEVGGRLGLACFFGPQNGQHLPFLHHVAAAAAAARLLELDVEGTAHALALSLAQPQTALWPAFLGPVESKVLTAAHPAELGLSAAEHAAAGLRGPLHILDHPRGFFGRFAFLPVRAALGGLGRTWLTHTLQVKRHAACWYFQAPLDAAEALLRRTGPLRAADIHSLRCDATLLATAAHGLATPNPTAPLLPNTVNFRLDLSLAVLLLEGRLTPVELAPERLAARQTDLRRVAAKTRVQHDPALSGDTIAAVHRALNVVGLLGRAGPLDILAALARARHEFADVPGPGAAELLGLARGSLQAVRALGRDRDAAYDLGDHADAVADLALPCGGTVTLTLADGTRLSETARVPAGALIRPTAGPVVEEKLRQGLAIAGASLADQTRLADAPWCARPACKVTSLLMELPGAAAGAASAESSPR
jgi:2-methylcitrate dehydratase PrpD